MTLSKLLENTEIITCQGNIDIKVSGIAFNSRDVKPGNVFVCISGFKTDGHQYAQDALERGAVAIVAERELEEVAATQVVVKNSRLALAHMAGVYYDYPFKKFCLIGVTGTNGKTTTTYLVKTILESCGQKVGLIGTNQNMIGSAIIPSHHTTPDSLELMQLFDRMAKEEVDTVVMEISSHSLALDRVAACSFDVGAFTNVTQDHLDFHETMENYIDAKALLFKMCKTGVINIDDNASERMISDASCDVIRYSTVQDTDLSAKNIEYKADGVQYTLCGKEEMNISLSTGGKFSVYNSMSAAVAALKFGIPTETVKKALCSQNGVKGRAEVVPCDRDFTIVIDYAHTPDGLQNILNTFKECPKNRLVVLFGCGGDRDKTKRPKMGMVAARLADFVIVTSDNPRTEEPKAIIDDILEGMKDIPTPKKVIENRIEAINFAISNAKAGDIIILAGKGHETYQIIGTDTIHLDEREVIAEALAK